VKRTTLAACALLIESTLAGDDAKWKDPDITWAVISHWNREVCIDAGLSDEKWMTLAKEKLGSRLATHPTPKELRSHAREAYGGESFFAFSAPMAVPETLVLLHETGVRTVTFKTLRGQLAADGYNGKLIRPTWAQGNSCAPIPETLRPAFAVRGTAKLIDVAKIVTDDSDPKHPKFTLAWYGHNHLLTGEEVGGQKANAAKIFLLGNGRRLAMLIWDSVDCDAAYTLLELRGATAKLITVSNWDCDT
jgi:hypothetical protein